MNYISKNYFLKTNFIWLFIVCWIKFKILNLVSKSLPSPIISHPLHTSIITHYPFSHAIEPKWIIYHYPDTSCSFPSLSFLLLFFSLGSSQLTFTCWYTASLIRPSSNTPSNANLSLFFNPYILGPQKLIYWGQGIAQVADLARMSLGFNPRYLLQT